MVCFSRSWVVLFSKLTFPGFCTERRPSSGWPRFFPSGGRGCVVQPQQRHLAQSPPVYQVKVWHGLWLQQGKGSVLERRWWWPILPPRNALVLFSLFEGRRFALLIQQDGGSIHEGARTPHKGADYKPPDLAQGSQLGLNWSNGPNFSATIFLVGASYNWFKYWP